MLRSPWYRLLPAGAALLLAACLFESRPLAGGGTDTESGGAKVVGRVLLPDGKPGACATLSLRSKAFLKEPPPIETAPGDWDQAADEEGYFAFDSVPAGEYLIEADCGGGNLALLEAKVEKGTGRVELGPVSLREAGAVRGRIRLEEGSRGVHRVQVYGLERALLVDSTGADFLLAPLPAATVTLRFSSQVPFQEAVDLPGLRVAEGETLDVGEIVLKPRPKQVFRVADGALQLAGVGSGNPILFDNDRFDNTADDDFLWALASAGHADLRGNILQGHPSAHPDSFRTLHKASLRELEIARRAGMRRIPDPVAGAGTRLVLPPSGNRDSILPIPSPGSALLVAEARQASPDRPLLVFCGGRATTVASALLQDPGIAENMVVFGTFHFNRPEEDSLAVFLLAKRARWVEWGRGFTWDGSLAKLADNPLPSSAYGMETWSRYASAATPFLFFGDLTGAGHVFGGKAFRLGQAANVSLPSNQVTLTADPRCDFVDIPAGATDYAFLQESLFRVLADSAAYHPWPVPGRVEGEAWSAGSGVQAVALDSGQGEAAGGLARTVWAEYRVAPDQPGGKVLEARVRAEAPGTLLVTGVDGRVLARMDLVGGGGWTLVRAPISLAAGINRLRFQAGSGGFDLDWLRILAE